MPRIATDVEYWNEVREQLNAFMDDTYVKCDGWQCGVPAKTVLNRFKKWVGRDGDLSYHTFYNALRELGYDLPVVKGYDVNTRVKGISLKERATSV